MLFLRHFCVLKQGPIQAHNLHVKQVGTVYTRVNESNNVNTSSTFAPSQRRGAFFEANA